MTTEKHEARADVFEDLRLSDIDELQKIKELFDRVTIDYLGLSPDLRPYQRSRAVEKVAKSLLHYHELERQAKEEGYKSLATKSYGASKRVRADLVPARYLIAPSQHLTKKASTAQKKWEEILPLLNELIDDPQLNDADWINLDEWIQTTSLDVFTAYLLEIKRQELNGEFDEEIQEARVREELEQRLLPMQERLGLLPAPQTKLLAAAEEKESVELRFVPTGATSNADEHLATKQLETMSDEDRELYEQCFS